MPHVSTPFIGNPSFHFQDHDIKARFPNEAAEFTYVRTYARWIEEEGRRENWEDTVDRYLSFIWKHLEDNVPTKVYRHIRKAMLLFGVMPSMRALWTAGPAAEVDNACMYNCSFQVIDKPEAFAECLYILMCGSGYGFSVEREYTEKLPEIPELNFDTDKRCLVVEDSRPGWADSVKELIYSLYSGYDLDIDYSEVRPKGARLKTMGGRASGPEPLACLHNFIRDTFTNAQGRKLHPIECHDIINEIGEIVVAGGVRRSSEISISDLNDQDMATAKVWPFPQRRRMANNSAAYNNKPSATEFLKEWSILASSGTGERGIFNRYSTRRHAPTRRNADLIIGTNPCGEINLRSEQFCNLSEVVMRQDDDLDMLFKKVETAVWLGAIQSTFTHFPYLNDNWATNCQEERLLGVSITGQMDNAEMLSDVYLRALKDKAYKVSKHAAECLNINTPASISCVKPSGTVSQLVNSASGMHPRYSKYYIRRYRISATDPLLKLMVEQGFNPTPENGESAAAWEAAQQAENLIAAKEICPLYVDGEEWAPNRVRTWVVQFPVKSPDNCITREDVSALDQLEHYKSLQDNWCEHNASCTVYVKDEEWFEVGNWVYKNWDIVSGISFLPFSGGKYAQAPYEEITEEEYNELAAATPKIDYSLLSQYEKADNTSGAKSYSCVGNKCELED